ncbi:hypothetical protein PN417_10015 [Halorubrum ezzemoulense]|uniref:hypothetical protein n=1 Tax=Halorubrum ezzemoulense TaxID=337243 RepID=UPI00232C8A66|nr:hypothetical protein [Halorubrum ezzemoulense]MDB9301270.1 hypothetical protein [Halorubrum ezzemoulense]
MPAMTTEAILGWIVLSGMFYVLGEYTDLFAFVLRYPKVALQRLSSAVTGERAAGAGGLAGGMYFGPEVWDIGASALGGLVGGGAGVIALDGLGLELTNGEIAAVGLVAVLAWVYASSEVAEGDD